jgi:L-threonylcarbamoyladenylate synthase
LGKTLRPRSRAAPSARVSGRRIDLDGVPADGAAELAGAIAAARLVCFPTDTVYGVGGLLSPSVRDAIVAAKARDSEKPVQVICPSVPFLISWLALGPALREAVERLLPGAYTLLLPHPPGLAFPPPGEVSQRRTGMFGVVNRPVRTIGVRVPAWPESAQAMAGLPFALLASSANPSGGLPPRAVDDIEPGLLAACDLVLDAGPVAGVASTILDLSAFATERTWRILRRGSADEREVAAVLGADGEVSAGS